MSSLPVFLASTATSPALQTLAWAIVAGVALILLARHLRLSAIVFLLLGGVLLGPQIIGLVQPSTLGEMLSPLISLCVGLILFEGGLSLDLEGYRRASKVIRRLLSLGVMITWLGTSLIIYLLFGTMFGEEAIPMSLLASSLVIVTGPTVIAPLLRRIRIKQNLNDILHWEGVLIDPIGVFIAILTYEAVTGTAAGDVIGQFFYRIMAGLLSGVIGGFGIAWLLEKKWIPDNTLNISILASAIMIFAVGDFLIPESGLLGVTVAGLVLGWRRPGPLKQIKEFKAEIADLLIGSLFVMLAAQLEFSQFKRFGYEGLLLVLAVMFIIRPLSVFACSYKSKMPLKEKIFLSYVAPRGIVAASMASLFALSLTSKHSWFLDTFTFSVIGMTVILQGLTAGLVARLLGLQLPPPNDWLIVGAHPFARRLATFMSSRGKVKVFLVDVNRKLIAESHSEGLTAAFADARDPELPTRNEYRTVGHVLALTDNEELNMIISQRWASYIGKENVYRWASDRKSMEVRKSQETIGNTVWQGLPKPSLVSAEMARGEITLSNAIAENIKTSRGQVTLFQVRQSGEIVLGPAPMTDQEKQQGGKTEALLLRREAEYLVRSIRPEMVIRLEGVKSMDKLFRELVERALLVEPRIDRQELLTELVEREKSFSTALGHAIAVPHGYSRHVSQRLCGIAQVPDGIDFDAPDGELVQLAFLIISPKGDPEGHLATMAEIARLLADKKVRKKLLEAPTPADLMAVLTSATQDNPGQ